MEPNPNPNLQPLFIHFKPFLFHRLRFTFFMDLSHKPHLNKPSHLFIYFSLVWPWRAPWRQLLPRRLRTHVFDVRGVIREHAVRCRVSITLPVSRWILHPSPKVVCTSRERAPLGLRSPPGTLHRQTGLNSSLFILLQNIEHLGDQDYPEMFTIKHKQLFWCVCVGSTNLPICVFVHTAQVFVIPFHPN